MDQILLTIAIPTYNRAKYLDRCLESLITQYKAEYQIEVIVSDNCSTDGTENVLEKYKKSSLPIKYIRNQANIGSDLNMMQCYCTAKGKYVLVFGDDDIFLEDFLSTLIGILKADDYGIVYLNYYGFTTDHKLERPKYNFFKANYEYRAERILKIIRSRIGFVSASVVNAKFINKDELLSYSGTILIQVSLFLKAIINSEKNLYVGDYLIAQQEANSGGFTYFEVLGRNYYQIISKALREKPRYLTLLANEFVLNFFVGALVESRKKNSSTVYEKEPLRFLMPYYKKNVLFWVCNYPIAKLPYFLALIYSYPIKVISKTINLINAIPIAKKLN